MARYIFNPVIDENLLKEVLDKTIEPATDKDFISCKELFRALDGDLPLTEDGHTLIGFFKSNNQTLLDYGLKPHRRQDRGYKGFCFK